MKRIDVLLILVALALFFFKTQAGAESALPPYETETSTTIIGACDAGETRFTVREGARYLVVITVVKSGIILYSVSTEKSTAYWVQKPDSAKAVEISHKEFDAILFAEAKNLYALRYTNSENDCAFQHSQSVRSKK